VAPYRVVDLSDERGQLCGHLLAALGADVILVEPPGGSSSRRVGPFVADLEGPERSLFHWAYNRGKRSMVLDASASEGRQQLLDLIAEADVLVESAAPGHLDALGLGRDVLEAINPGLVHVSITAFGTDGPKASWAATDLTVAAASGVMALTGDEDRPPLRVSLPQSFLHAAADAAGAALVALRERERSGRGQHVDASAQQSHSVATQSFLLSHPANAATASRVAGGVRTAGLDAKVQLLWPCKDGHVSVTFLFGAAIAPFTKNLMDWVCEEGFCDEATRDKDWENYGVLLFDGREPVAEYERVKQVLHDFFGSKTKAELYQATFTRRVLIAPVTTTAELVASEQLAARDFWEDVECGEHGTVRFPGAFAKLSATPLRPRPAPATLDEHRGQTWAHPKRTLPPSAAVPPTSPPLEGLKVADFSWVFAGPWASRVLAELGATVVRVESAHHLDALRTSGNFQDEVTHPDWALQFGNVNPGKSGITLDLSVPEARDVALDLVRWSDVTMESFTPKAMRAWGLDYASLRAVKPDLIMTSSCLMGQYGPEAELAGFGTMAAAVSGWFHITGWPDRAPCGPFLAYTDYVSPRFLLLGVLAALEHRDRTGEGQYIDLSQAEASLQLLTPAVLDHTVNGRVLERIGNDDPLLAPHGVYPAQGDDQWVAVAVEDDDQWRALCGELGRPDLADLPVGERRTRRRHLDELVTAWTADRSAGEAEAKLQAAGVAAHQVQGSAEAYADPQLHHRGHFLQVPHGAMGTTWVEGSRLRLSRTPALIDRGAPTLGEHSWEVLTGILGYDDDRAAELAVAGIFG
jgi:crotonobetainyl-CoA:carnitine CoA-transferase CaiB-like acyl-CoA transferase